MDPDIPFKKTDPGDRFSEVKLIGVDEDPLSLMQDLEEEKVVCISEEGRCHYVKLSALGDSLKL